MRLPRTTAKKVRIEMMPLIDVIFLLLVFFIYSMLSMTMQRGVSVALPSSTTAVREDSPAMALSITADGTLYLDKEVVASSALTEVLAKRAADLGGTQDVRLTIQADKNITFDMLYNVIDSVKQSNIHKISLQAKHK